MLRNVRLFISTGYGMRIAPFAVYYLTLKHTHIGKPSSKLIKDKACMAGLFLWRDYNKIMFNEVKPSY